MKISVSIRIAIVGTILSLLALSFDKNPVIDAKGQAVITGGKAEVEWAFDLGHIDLPEVFATIFLALLLLIVTNQYDMLSKFRQVEAVAEEAKSTAKEARSLISGVKKETANIVNGYDQLYSYPRKTLPHSIAEHILSELTGDDAFIFGDNDMFTPWLH